MNEELNTYMELIKKHAGIALMKMKKSRNYDLEDLIQEGVIAYLEATKYHKKNRGASFKTFLTLCLRRYFTSLISLSYKDKRVGDGDLDYIDETSFRDHRKLHDPSDILQVSFLVENLDGDELEYVYMMVSSVDVSRKYRRKVARKLLGISYERECELRRSIRDKIKK